MLLKAEGMLDGMAESSGASPSPSPSPSPSLIRYSIPLKFWSICGSLSLEKSRLSRYNII
jgi:hypothetical protein